MLRCSVSLFWPPQEEKLATSGVVTVDIIVCEHRTTEATDAVLIPDMADRNKMRTVASKNGTTKSAHVGRKWCKDKKRTASSRARPAMRYWGLGFPVWQMTLQSVPVSLFRPEGAIATSGVLTMG